MYRLMAVLALLAGCRGVPAKVTVPPVDQIDLLEVQPNSGEIRPIRQVVEKERVRAFLALIERVKSEEREFDSTWYTYPCSAFTVSVNCRGEKTAVFWISPGHIGGRSPLAEERFLWPISDEEWRHLAAILDLSISAEDRQQ